MRVELTGLGTLTTEHPTSSYGLPILLVDGEPYGPADLLSWRDHMAVPAEGVVLRWLNEYHALPSCDCDSDEVDGKLVWVKHCPECAAILEAVGKWLAPLGYRVPR